MLRFLSVGCQDFVLYRSLTLLGLICLRWSAFALPLQCILPSDVAAKVGRRATTTGFRIYAWSLAVTRVLLLFPEDTRSTFMPINPLAASAGLIAKHAAVPVQTLVIETDSPYLSKGWPLFRRPALPILYRVRLGKRFAPPTDVAAFTAALELYHRNELEGALQSRWLEGKTNG